MHSHMYNVKCKEDFSCSKWVTYNISQLRGHGVQSEYKHKSSSNRGLFNPNFKKINASDQNCIRFKISNSSAISAMLGMMCVSFDENVKIIIIMYSVPRS